MYNKVILAGNLTRDIEIRYTQGGMAVASTGIASNRKFKSANGEQKEEVLFIDLTFFGRTAEIANQYLRKGSKVLVDGRLKLDSWTAQDGSKRSKHSVTVENLQMLSSRDEAPMSGGGYSQPDNGGYTNSNSGYAQQAPSQTQAQQPSPAQQAPETNIPEIDITEDEIPF
jgi:single-strand DNA-binding protein